MDKTTKISLEDELFSYWKKGWPDYIGRQSEDLIAIRLISKECAEIARVNLECNEGRERIGIAVMRIAEYCKTSKDWGSKSLFFINKVLPSILQEMQYDRRTKKIAEEQKRLSDPYYQDQLKAKENEQLIRECQERSLKWYKEHWTDEMEADYQRWLESGMKIPKMNL